MQKCLGIYIEDNLIKYAKVSKERETTKVESFGIRFFQNLNDELKKIVEETYSFNTPISINIANEKYLYFDIFALLNKKDVEKTVQTEFENFCEEKKYNENAFETRYALMPKKDDNEKIRALDIYINKIELNRQIDLLSNYKLTKVMPMPITIANIARLNKRENQLIINMEETTTVTTIYSNQIYAVDTIEAGSKEVLDKINKQENSYAKAYEICKNTTIYTADSEELNIEGNDQNYLQDIMPTVYKIADQLKEIINNTGEKFQTIYLTGTLATINNIDLYFQEFFPDVDCKILKPNIVDEAVTKINIKEYVEANSAIALATAGLGEGIQELNFKKVKSSERLSNLLKIDLPGSGSKEGKKINIQNDFKTTMTTMEMNLVRIIVAILIVLIIYTIFSRILWSQMTKKEDEIKGYISAEQTEISKVNSNTSQLDTKTDAYKKLISELDRINEKINDAAARRNSIPTLLYQIMSNIPDKVQVTRIENTTDRTIVIQARAYDYKQLGTFIAAIKAKTILRNVISSSSSKSTGIVTITIEGELP